MRLAILAFAAVTAFAASAHADTMAEMFGNTVIVVPPGGAAERYAFDADGTVSFVTPDGGPMKGKWARRAPDGICLTVNDEQHCATLPADKKVGDSWKMNADDGTELDVTIVKGRQ